MPLIKGVPDVRRLTPDDRRELLDAVRAEMDGGGAGGPVVFEIPLPGTNKYDVLVVWDGFEGVAGEDRSSIIAEAYEGRDVSLAQPLGVTVTEALREELLPVRVAPDADAAATHADELNELMRREGAVTTSGGGVELRLPNLSMAKEAHRRLTRQFPEGFWSIIR